MEEVKDTLDVMEILSDIDDLPADLQQRIRNFIAKLDERRKKLNPSIVFDNPVGEETK